MKNIYALLCITAMLVACGPNKSDVLAKYEQLKAFAQQNNYQSLYNEFDGSSKRFVQQLLKHPNLDYKQSRKIGNQYKLPLFCAIYAYDLAEAMDKTSNKEGLFLNYLSEGDLPIFGKSDESVVDKNNIWVGDETYLLASKVLDNHISLNQKILFVQDSVGNLKLDFISLLQLSESQLNLEYQTFLDEESSKIDSMDIGFDMLPYYLAHRS